MAADFVFFIGIAAVCFSGLLYTLHSLGMFSGLRLVRVAVMTY